MRPQVTIHNTRPGSLCIPPLPGTHDPGTTSRENARRVSGSCNVTAASGSPRTLYPSLPQAQASQSPKSAAPLTQSCLSRNRCLRRPTCRGGSKSKAEPQELCEQRREREISHGSLRSSGLNLHNQRDVPCICGTPEKTTNHPKLRMWTLGARYIIFSPFPLFVSVYVYDSV